MLWLRGKTMTQTSDQLLQYATDQLVSLQARLDATYAAIDRGREKRLRAGTISQMRRYASSFPLGSGFA